MPADADNKTGAHLDAILVDYGPAFSRVTDNINTNGVRTLTTSDCWGESSAADSACYKDVGEIVDTASTAWRVSKGVLDSDHKDSLTDPAPIVAGQRYPFSFPPLPADYTFPAGHRIGVVVVGSYQDYGTGRDAGTPAQITLSEQASRVTLPVVGGGATLTVAGPGHLRNSTSCADGETQPVAQPGACGSKGAFTLAQPLRVEVAPARWSGPVSHATSLITFTQPIAANDPLRTGTYAKTLTFTLSTTQP